MVVGALVISCLALLLSALVALAVMELVADGASTQRPPSDDTIQELDMSAGVAGTPASSHGLPEWVDRTETQMALIVSPMCGMCEGLVRSFEGVVPEGIIVVVTAAEATRQREWATVLKLSHDKAVFDDDMSIVNSLGVSSSPTIVAFSGGRVVFMVGIGGRSALDTLLKQRLEDLRWNSHAQAESNTNLSLSDKPGDS